MEGPATCPDETEDGTHAVDVTRTTPTRARQCNTVASQAETLKWLLTQTLSVVCN